MIDRVTSQFDWVFDMPIESQCHFAVGLSLFGFVVAAVVRETVKHSGVRYLARAIGAASFFAVASFAHHVAHENEKLNTELMVKASHQASKIADAAVFSSFKTKSGNIFTIGSVSDAGRTGAMCAVSGQCGRKSSNQAAETGCCRCCDQCVCSRGHGIDRGTDSIAELHCGKQSQSESKPAYDNGESF